MQTQIGHGGDIRMQTTLVFVIAISLVMLWTRYVQQKPAPIEHPRNGCSSETSTGLEELAASNTTFSMSKGYLYARLSCCFSLSSLAALELYGDLNSSDYFSWILRNSEVACYFYVTMLVILALKVKSPFSRTCPLHHDSVMAFIFFIYAYQYLWPLATYSRGPVAPMDILLSSRIVLLFVDGILLPLATPYFEVFHPSNQEARGLSLWSQLTYSYLDHLIYLCKPEAIQESVPPIGLQDKSENLTHRASSILGRQRLTKGHIFWGVLFQYRNEFVLLSFLQLTHTVLALTGPIGLNGLLRYLEKRGEGSYFKPWVWICILFFGPSIRSVTLQLFTSIANRVMVQLEAILVCTVYEYTLRSRYQVDAVHRDSRGSSNLAGRINNLATSDIANIVEGVEPVFIALYSPVMVLTSLWFLFSILGWSAVLGFVVMILMLPLPGRFATTMQELQKTLSEKTNARVQRIVEVMSMFRTIKLLGWESRVKRQVDQARGEEVNILRKFKVVELLTGNLNFIMPLVTMLITYSSYTLIFQKELTHSASRLFASIGVFDSLRLHIRAVLLTIPGLSKGKVSFDRLDDFLRNSEVVTSNGQRALDPSAFRLKVHGEILFKPGLSLITGPTGSGKSSMLMALLGEMHPIPQKDSWIKFPREDGVAYAAQDSWIQSGTVKDNIIFGSPYDELRYEQVILECGLRQDLTLLPHGDLTQIGERGLTLRGISGGQRTRVTLARAVYSSARILLLDDVLAALDTTTGKWISQRCFAGSLMHGRIVLLVSHNIGLLRDLAVAAVTINSEGTCAYEEYPPVYVSTQQRLNTGDNGTDVLKNQAATGVDTLVTQSITPEEMYHDRVKRPAFELHLGNMSHHPIALWAAVMFLMVGNETLSVIQTWWMGVWASRYETHPPSTVSAPFYLLILVGMIALSVLMFNVYYMLFVFGALKASGAIHSLLFKSVLGSTWRWLDVTPSARVIVRATQDIRIIDGSLPNNVRRVTELNVSMLAKFVAIIIYSPFYIVPALVISFLVFVNGQCYIRAQLPVRRMVSNSKSPILAHLSETVDGLVSIRAYGAQQRYLEECMKRIDTYTRIAMAYRTMSRWVSLRSDVLGALFTAGLSAYLVYGSRQVSASNAGFSLAMAVVFNSMILSWVRNANNLKLDGIANSLERIYDYTTLEQERTSSEALPPAHWPIRGQLRVVNLSGRYSPDGEDVIKNLSFKINGGERVGIVGRTGAGKSSLVLALLHCLVIRGEVYYDGIPASKLGVTILRSKFTVIPQTPDLFDGTLRDNLDPFDDFDDVELYAALRSVEMSQTDSGSQFVLDTRIIDKGKNFSVGQRQVITLARALLQGNKILILDEATSAIDHEMDSAIQKVLRHALRDVTILTVAHRLRTVMDFDRIMVLNEGRIVEFDKPSVLLQKKTGYLKDMVNNSADRDELYALATG